MSQLNIAQLLGIQSPTNISRWYSKSPKRDIYQPLYYRTPLFIVCYFWKFVALSGLLDWRGLFCFIIPSSREQTAGLLQGEELLLPQKRFGEGKLLQLLETTRVGHVPCRQTEVKPDKTFCTADRKHKFRNLGSTLCTRKNSSGSFSRHSVEFLSKYLRIWML